MQCVIMQGQSMCIMEMCKLSEEVYVWGENMMLEFDKSVEIRQNGRRIWFKLNSALKWFR